MKRCGKEKQISYKALKYMASEENNGVVKNRHGVSCKTFNGMVSTVKTAMA
jgi:hypothetical protein